MINESFILTTKDAWLEFFKDWVTLHTVPDISIHSFNLKPGSADKKVSSKEGFGNLTD